ncbi:hypothetical protein [Arsenophonus sp.]|uniref:hypothetical protein n=1 Tax=Arsenophonus sp. TaxID=1872640 RepID=UPI0028603E24|nr:hypothetical protein [Arsenophonus sp.]MDR5616812.1 hypothetical protein [Arsenophonus sp.]
MSAKRLLITMIVAFVIGFMITKVAFDYIIINSSITPLILITILFFPASYAVQAMLKIPEASEHTQLTLSELRRLKGIIVIKQRKLSILIWFYAISAVISAILFLQAPVISMNTVIAVNFGLIVASLSSLSYVSSIMTEIQSFKSLIIHRADKTKKKND